MRTSGILVSGLVAAIVVGGAATAQGQVAIGPPLDAPIATTESCEAGVLPQLRGVIPVPTTCTLMGSSIAGQWTAQVPRGSWRITSATIRTGARTGPMRIQVIRNMRSQATGIGGGPGGAICCTSPAQSQVFTLPANTVTTVPVNVPVKNAVESVDGERVEVVDYLGITILDRNSSLPVGQAQGNMLTMFLPALNQGGQDLMGPSFQGLVPLVGAVVCPAAGANTLSTGGASLHQGGCASVPTPTPTPTPTPSPTPTPTPPGSGPQPTPAPGAPAGPSPAPTPGAGAGAARAVLPVSLRQVGVADSAARVRVPLACAAGRCAGTLAATTVKPLRASTRAPARRVAIPARAFRVAAGPNAAATLVLPPPARRELARTGTLPLRLTLRPQGAAAQTRTVTLRTLPGRVRAIRGRVAVALDVPPAAAASRPAQVELRQGSRAVARATARTRPGRVVSVPVRLSAADRARLARAGALRRILRVTYRDASGTALVRSRPLTITAAGR